MLSNRHQYLQFVFIITLGFLLSACQGSGSSSGSLLDEIEVYPGATQSESLTDKLMSLAGSGADQYRTADDFAKVLTHYTNSLYDKNPSFSSSNSELGQQTNITLKQAGETVTIIIMEDTQAGLVYISHLLDAN